MLINYNEVLKSLLIAILAGTCLCWYIQWKRSRKALYKLGKIMPYAPNVSYLPLIGHAHHFIGSTEKILNSTMKFCIEPGPISVWLGHRLFVGINTPEQMGIILNHPKCLKKEDLYKLSIKFLGLGLFNADVPLWKRHRKFILPTFKQKNLDEFVTVFGKNAEICVEVLRERAGDTVDMFQVLSKYALDTVCETGLGVTCNSMTTESVLEQKIARTLDIIMMRMFNIIYHSELIFNLTSYSKEEKENVDYFRGFVSEMVYKKQENFRRTRKSNEPSSIKAFLDHMIESSEEENLTDEELIDEACTFIVAGSDTTGTIGNFVLAMIAMHKDVEQKVYEEILEVVGPDRAIDYTDLPNLEYLEKVIKETLRLFPVGPCIVRMTTDEVQLDEYTLPKDVGIVLVIMAIHRSPRYYKDPLRFDPERFSPEEIAKRHKYSWLPFSAGPRNCIGYKYGMMVLKYITATLVRKFKFDTEYKKVEEIKLKQSIIIKSLDPIYLNVTLRN